MLGAAVDLVFGPMGAILGVAVAAIAAFLAGKSRADLEAGRDYAERRRELDETDLGVGASDSERIERLRDIARGGPSHR